MGHISGKAGAVYSTATGVTTYAATGMKSWSLDYVGDALETTDFGDSGHRTYIPGLDGWSGSFEGYKDGAPHIVVNHTAIIELRESTNSTQKWTGVAIITGGHPTVDVDGIIGLSYDFQGTGVLAPPTA
ncbi:hypothetical protein ES703_09102 [subsurface metagenome]